MTPSPTLLLILDGWGCPATDHDVSAISARTAPHFFEWLKTYPHTELAASGAAVGLFEGQEGNSEAGHLNLGAGRVVKQDALYVSEAIEDGTFFKNTAFHEAVHHLKKYNTAAHVMGLLSNHNSAHSSPEHVYALLDLLSREGITKVYLHLFTDGRDSGEHDALQYLKKLRDRCHGSEQIASICGRLYSMDRNKNWQRTEQAYNAIVNGSARHTTTTAEAAIAEAYNRGESDEFVAPTVMVTDQGKPVGPVEDNDVVFFFNLRSDRARQLTKAFVQPDFTKANAASFDRVRMPAHIRFVAMTDFGPDLPGVLTAFPSRDVVGGFVNQLGERRQLYVAESEKFAHITYFFNGGYADHSGNITWLKIPSDSVERFTDKPAMQAAAIAEALIKALESKQYDLLAANFANADMLGHTGQLGATEESIRVLDVALERVVSAALATGATVFITADHGNAEEMKNIKTGEIDTEHSRNPVPFVVVAPPERLTALGLKGGQHLRAGSLADVAPSVLKSMEIAIPGEMTGRVLW